MSQRHRRWLISIMQLGMSGYALALAFGEINSLWIIFLIFSLQALYTVVHFRVVRPVAKEIGNRKIEELDERQVVVRDRAHHHAYQILAMVIITVTTAPMFAALYLGVHLPLQLTYWHFAGLFFFFTNLSISLPESVISWNEPDPDSDEE